MVRAETGLYVLKSLRHEVPLHAPTALICARRADPSRIPIALAATVLAKPQNAQHIRDSVPPVERGWIPELFEVEVRNQHAVCDVIHGHPLEVQAQGWLAASILVEAKGGTGTAPWRRYRQEAAKLALPGLIPVWE